MAIKDNLRETLEEIESARKHSLTGEEVKLIAVSKTHSPEEIKEAIECGITDIGENKVQELQGKMEILQDSVKYHMIGNLQSNKVKYIYDKVELIHSLDRKSLLKEINKRAKNDDIIVNCLLEINIAKEESKGGMHYNEVEKFIETCLNYDNVKINGLMTVAPNTEDEAFLRECFRKMFKLKEVINNKNYDKNKIEMKYLSMGMSQDFKIAIEEGSNMVRVGTKIFGKRDYK
ncbi:YggS family pyridoxal phosphate-dependent enzyme [Peptoniphilus stercorisuis]|uniref:Pyridoxal phosphate homeostasis protein n=1 Tax=Peptoniphilus stercorisuis TaxID=1436965 RepID=A0ABS4KBQ4_9FIRM|nr:pyridoxal phosphate enzyme (YggS family) [Peptoniphilus stercorisuis]